MTGRERIFAAFERKEVDRVPIDFSGHRSSGIMAIAYARLREYLNLPAKPVRVYDPMQQLAIVDEDVLERFGVDTIELGRAFATDDSFWADWILPDGTACKMPTWAIPEREGEQWILRSRSGRVIARMPDGTLYFEQAWFPFAEEENPRLDPDGILTAMEECMWTAIGSPPGPLAAGPDGKETLIKGAQRLRKFTERAIIGLFGGNLLEIGQFLFRNDNFFILLASEQKKAHKFLDSLLELHLANLENFLATVGQYIDVIVFGDDLGMQTGPQISPQMYREFFKPRHAGMWKRAKELADVKTNLHCCGSVRELLPDLIDAGLDSINPVQINCSGMALDELKRDFGKDIVFWGGGNTQRILPKANPEEVAQHVRHQLDVFGNAGGFVFQQVHNIMADVPPENIVAMFDTAQFGHF